VVKLGKRAKGVLLGDERVMLRVAEGSEEPKVVKERTYDSTLLEELKALRTKLARAQEVPPYVIFSDASLVQMSSEIPTTKRDFLAISGVGQVKLAKYGDDFLAILRKYGRTTDTPPNLQSVPWNAYELAMLETQAKEGVLAEEIAGVLGRPVGDVQARVQELGL